MAIAMAIIAVLGLAVLFASRGSNRPLMVVAGAMLGAILLIPLIYILNRFTVRQLVEGYIAELASIAGMTEFLAKALSIAFVIPALIGFGMFFSPSRERRFVGKLLIVLFFVGYYGIVWLATRGQLVDIVGNPLKCYVVTEEGVKYREIRDQGFDPQTGRRCEPVRPEMIPRLQKLHDKLVANEPLQPMGIPYIRFFSAATGDPLVWFYRTPAGDYEFYDLPGFHPVTGDLLQPVTREVAQDWQRLVAERWEEAREAARREELRKQEEAWLEELQPQTEQPAEVAAEAEPQPPAAEAEQLAARLPSGSDLTLGARGEPFR